ncbi:ero1-like protein isoform X2 [Cimex lectularius]|uniref:Ero1-like protein n=1 Tax=Cimex lectularius TaxID=79782 RepID=A0A8I6RX03_CIMLE|nr:ero1-like protein isoform X2 [Cimex lectularius]
MVIRRLLERSPSEAALFKMTAIRKRVILVFFCLFILLCKKFYLDEKYRPETGRVPDEVEGSHRIQFKLKGQIDDCSCKVDTVDYFNNVKIFPRLLSLLRRDYFRFYKVNLNKACPFWSDDSMCALKFCNVKPCKEEEIPPGLKGVDNHYNEDMHVKYLESSQNPQESECNSDSVDELGYLNMTISASAAKDFELWNAHDTAQDNFCTMPDDGSDAQYVDLMLNPERYTGYKGDSAHRIWRSIYMENCFRPKNSYAEYIPSSKLNGLCLEKRAFYRVISGLHASINIHLSANYLFTDKLAFSLTKSSEGDHWGHNLEEFKRRFSPEQTSLEGPQWLKNLYFLYLLELRAVAKAAPYLSNDLYYTGNSMEDADTRTAIKDFLQVVSSFPDHFNERSMFSGGQQAAKLKEEFRLHFHNISRIMDCVGCEKCKLWGKLQVQGLGTALKILFSKKFDSINPLNVEKYRNNKTFHLERSEIVSLFNALGRLSTSIHEIENFRRMMR